MTISLSTRSQELISTLARLDPRFVPVVPQQTTIDKAFLLKWLGQSHPVAGNEQAFFLITSLQASLLKDLDASLDNPLTHKDKPKKNSKLSKAKLALLALAGTIYFACEGFDGVTAIMGFFSFVPTVAFFIAGTLFSILSVVVFYNFDLVEISKHLGVKSADAPKLLDVLLEEFKQIKSIRRHLAKPAHKTLAELEQDLDMARMLLKRHEDLNDARSRLKQALEHPYLKAGKMIAAAGAGIIFFGGGFFAGQAVALTLAGLFVPAMAATAWPIVAAGIVVGLAAFSIYWFVERPGIENLIRRWNGLDKEKMDKLCKPKAVDRETEKLQYLIQGIEEKIALQRTNVMAQAHVQTLEQEVSRLQRQLTANAPSEPQRELMDKQGDEPRNRGSLPPRHYSLFHREQSLQSPEHPEQPVHPGHAVYG